MSGDERVIRQLALHEQKGASLVVSRVGERKTLTLPTRPIAWKHLPGRVAEGAHGRKLAVIEADMPLWLARDRGLA